MLKKRRLAASGVMRISGCLSARQQQTLLRSARWPQAVLSSATAHVHRLPWYSRQTAALQFKGFLSVASTLLPDLLRQPALAEASCGGGCGQVFTCPLHGPCVSDMGLLGCKWHLVQATWMLLQRLARPKCPSAPSPYPPLHIEGSFVQIFCSA